jgi:hypothetical protein
VREGEETMQILKGRGVWVEEAVQANNAYGEKGGGQQVTMDGKKIRGG